MPGIRTAARALIVRDGSVLVICYHDKQGEWFALPGGGQRHGEELTTTLVREVLEETGFTVRVGPLRFVREVIAARVPAINVPAGLHQVEHVFLCEIEEGPSQDAVNPDVGQAGCRWVPVTELRSGRFFPRALLDALEKAHVVYLGAAE
jgi:ADP-ribose pyrophosphatase YjhB (NUDIX family)